MITPMIYNNTRFFIALITLTISLQSGAKQVKISGDLMLDHDSFESGFLESNESNDVFSFSEIRRARISIKTKLMDDWKAKLKVNFSDDSTEIKDAYLKYKGWDWADVTIGQQKEGFGLEKLAHSRDALMIERSIVTSALVPGRSLGVSLAGGDNVYNWQVGAYQPDESESSTAITGRAAWLPFRKGNELVHIGGAFSERDLNGSDYRINEKMEVHLSDSLIEGKKLLAEKESLVGLEFLWQQSGFTTLAEWQKSTVTDVNNATFEYHGGFVQLSYQLSGDNREYKKGELGAVTSHGWEFTSRYSQFELVEEAHEAKIYSVGANYTFNKQLKLMANFIKAKQNEKGSEGEFTHAFSMRMQYTF